MPARPVGRSELEAALQRVLALPLRDQLEVLSALRESLSADLADADDARDKQIEERAGALQAIEAVSDKLKLPKGLAPTSTQFRQLAPTVAPGWNVTRISRAFGRWRLAQRVFLGEAVAETAAQRDLRRSRVGRKRSHEDVVTGVRAWLETKPLAKDQL